jgi:hypothetical protein
MERHSRVDGHDKSRVQTVKSHSGVKIEARRVTSNPVGAGGDATHD